MVNNDYRHLQSQVFIMVLDSTMFLQCMYLLYWDDKTWFENKNLTLHMSIIFI